eukprot:358229-Chlamydomonas_euryale.AAC.11
MRPLLRAIRLRSLCAAAARRLGPRPRRRPPSYAHGKPPARRARRAAARLCAHRRRQRPRRAAAAAAPAGRVPAKTWLPARWGCRAYEGRGRLQQQNSGEQPGKNCAPSWMTPPPPRLVLYCVCVCVLQPVPVKAGNTVMLGGKPEDVAASQQLRQLLLAWPHLRRRVGLHAQHAARRVRRRAHRRERAQRRVQRMHANVVVARLTEAARQHVKLGPQHLVQTVAGVARNAVDLGRRSGARGR